MDRKTKIISFVAVVVVVLFTYSVVQVFNKNSAKEIAKLEQINADAKVREQVAKIERDAAILESKKVSTRLTKVEGELKVTNGILDRFQNSYNNSLIELNKYRNEKDFVPDNATTAEQSEFLSKYRYKEY